MTVMMRTVWGGRVRDLLAAVAAVCIIAGSAWADDAPFDTAKLTAAMVEAIEDAEYEVARDIAKRIADATPDDPIARYNLACAHALVGDDDKAEDTLVEAISLGFVDFHHLLRDPHLASIRDSETVRRVELAWADLLEQRAAANERQLREDLGSRYTVFRVPELRLIVASSFDERITADAVAQLERVAAWTREHLPAMVDMPEDRPDPWVTVVLPTPEHFVDLVGIAGVGGIYERDARRLISRDIGASLRHEFFHVLHWRHMDRLGQRHPLWIQEGLAALFEDMAEPGAAEDGDFVPSWRTNMAKRMLRSRLVLPWERFASMPRRAFMGSRARGNYAQARAMMMFLASEGALGAYYDALVTGFADDRRGVDAVTAALGEEEPRAVDRRFRAWLAALPDASEIGRAMGGALDVELEPGEGDGPRIARPVTGVSDLSGGRGLRMGDVILAIDGVPTPTLDELYRVLGGYEPGDRVTVQVRSGRRVRDVEVELQEPVERP